MKTILFKTIIMHPYGCVSDLHGFNNHLSSPLFMLCCPDCPSYFVLAYSFKNLLIKYC